MKISVSNFPMLGDGLDARDIVRLAQAADGAGVDRLCIADWPFHEECSTLMTASLAETERLQLESLVTTPFHRAPDLTASTWATISELSEGRAILGIGRGGGGASMWAPPWGWSRPDGLVAVEELIDICQAMWAGEAPPLEGKVLHTSGRKLGFVPRWKIPILVAARGPKMLSLAARRADIVHLALPLIDHSFMKSNVDLVVAAAAAAGRSPKEVEIDLTVGISIAEDHGRAREAAKGVAAVGIMWSSGAEDKVNERRRAQEPRSEAHQIAVPGELIEALSTRWNTWADEPMPPDISEMFSDEIIEQFAVFGTVEECGTRLRDIVDRLDGVTGLRLKLPRVFGSGPFEQYEEMVALCGQLHRHLDR
jgi:alkanesulfonate monooxygenase SsuD/methylene tetrahydromethanopterin reductase-like flavin-dependent oxidoreductase (luciferase family)